MVVPTENTGGGGGHGDPTLRDTAAIAADVAQGYT
jgi:N-methylhydantoinase B/oxoprolinase/acetone carboxylase alpha subunit